MCSGLKRRSPITCPMLRLFVWRRNYRLRYVFFASFAGAQYSPAFCRRSRFSITPQSGVRSLASNRSGIFDLGSGVGFRGAFLISCLFSVHSCCSRPLLERIVLATKDQPEKQRYALLFIMAYSFMSRLPSEALPAVAGREENVPEAHSVVYESGGRLILKLQRRKNKPEGSTLCRSCSCKVYSVELFLAG